MTDTVCGFYAVNGKHCVINGRCVVCKEPAEKQFTKGEVINLAGFGPLDGKYRIVGLFEGTLKLEFVK